MYDYKQSGRGQDGQTITVNGASNVTYMDEMCTYAALWWGCTGGLVPYPTTKLLPVLPSMYSSCVFAKARPAVVWIPLSAATSARNAVLAAAGRHIYIHSDKKTNQQADRQTVNSGNVSFFLNSKS